jgi:hypothetical protein
MGGDAPAVAERIFELAVPLSVELVLPRATRGALRRALMSVGLGPIEVAVSEATVAWPTLSLQ